MDDARAELPLVSRREKTVVAGDKDVRAALEQHGEPPKWG
jgi:hypothetical protein